MLEVVEPGLLTTVQDAGRPAAVALGVPVGGACDRWALAAANALVGNGELAAALEMTLSGATLRALSDCLVGVAGAEMDGIVVESGAAVTSGSAVVLHAGETLRFATPADGAGCRTYLALPGGVDVPSVLDSRSTCLIGGFGGLAGRPLRAGDIVGAADTRLGAGHFAGSPALLGSELRVVRGIHLDRLAGDAFAALIGGEWRVGGRGDRQGIRLDGSPIDAGEPAPLLSHGVVWGAVQLPPDGNPIVLLADAGTTGGYPLLAVVISADLPRLAQLVGGDPVRFVEVTFDEARRALVGQRQALAAAMRHAGDR